MQELVKNISNSYNLDVKKIEPYKDAFIVHSSTGKILLKKSFLAPEHILFIHGAKEHLVKNGFKCIDRYICSNEGAPYITEDQHLYTLSRIIDGRECNFDIRDEVIKASRLLALLHEASKGYTVPKDGKINDRLGSVPKYYKKRLDELKKLRKIAKKGKSKFDYTFLEHFDYFYEIGEKAIEGVTSSCYEKLVDIARKEKVFCHHDYTHHNIILGGNNLYITNFEYCCYDLPIYDLVNFIRRKMRKCDWSVNEARLIIKEYGSLRKLSEDEFYIMKNMFMFPQKFWRIANKYYNSRRSWSEKIYLSRLREVIGEKEQHKRFIENYDKLTIN